MGIHRKWRNVRSHHTNSHHLSIVEEEEEEVHVEPIAAKIRRSLGADEAPSRLRRRKRSQQKDRPRLSAQHRPKGTSFHLSLKT